MTIRLLSQAATPSSGRTDLGIIEGLNIDDRLCVEASREDNQEIASRVRLTFRAEIDARDKFHDFANPDTHPREPLLANWNPALPMSGPALRRKVSGASEIFSVHLRTKDSVKSSAEGKDV